MTGWNMPPGVDVCDIPGNRPEDMALETAIESICDDFSDVICTCFDEEEARQIIDKGIIAMLAAREEGNE